MMEFNKEVANKIYTFLVYWLLKPEEDQRIFMNMMSMMYPSNWDNPTLTESLHPQLGIARNLMNIIASDRIMNNV